MSQVIGLPNNSYKHITNTEWVRARLCKLLKGCTRLAATSDKVYQLLAHGRWFSPGTPASSTTKTGRHDIVEILLNVALNTINQIKSNPIDFLLLYMHIFVMIIEIVKYNKDIRSIFFFNNYDFIQFNIHVYIKSFSNYKQNPPDNIFIKTSQHLHISY